MLRGMLWIFSAKVDTIHCRLLLPYFITICGLKVRYYGNLKALVRKDRGLFHGTVKSFVFWIWCRSVVLFGHGL